MSTRSSAWFISYDIRPGKQIERRLVLECLQAAKSVPYPVRGLPFIGMGGVRYIDFLLANKVVGLSDFTTLEHDKSLIERCEFNKPFGCISVYEGTATDFVNGGKLHRPAIVWFDFEEPMSHDVKDDLVLLGAAAKPGSFVFITANAEMPDDLEAVKGIPKRMDILRERFGSFADEVEQKHLEPRTFFNAAARLMLAFLTFGFRGRADGVFAPFLRVAYKDSYWMVTVGGFFGAQSDGKAIVRAVKRSLSFLKPADAAALYQVEQFNITDAERRLFDLAALPAKRSRQARTKLRRLGFRESILKQYPELMRFIPRYFEALI